MGTFLKVIKPLTPVVCSLNPRPGVGKLVAAQI